MRPHRIKCDGCATYHVMSRVIEHRLIFKEIEKSYMSGLMRRLEAFTGCEVRTYAFMDNHFHILLHVPEKMNISDDEVKRRAKVLYGKTQFAVMAQNWEQWEQKGQSDRVKAQLDKFRVRMYDLSEFMKTFKQRLSIYYNSNNARRGAGPLWHDRYKSVLVEEHEHALAVVAAYIDLNPVRAGIVSDPKDYRWSGYAESVAKGGVAIEGIFKLFMERCLDGQEVLSVYRQKLYCQGAENCNALTGDVIRPGFKREVVEKVLEADGKLSLQDVLQCRVRYFSDGLIIGSKVFVEQMFHEYSGKFSQLRLKRGVKQMKGGHWGDLCAAGELRSKVIDAPVRKNV